MKLRLRALLAAFAFTLGGCATIWDAAKGEITYTDVGEDRLLALRLTSAAAGGIPADTLILIGEKNWYVADEGSSNHFKYLIPYLTADLSTPFYFADDNPVIILGELNQSDFSMTLHLVGKPDAADRARLKEIGTFEPDADGEYRLVYQASGTYYPAPTTLPADDRAIPINLPLRLRQSGFKRSIPGTAVAVIAAPIALAADAVTLITVAPLIKIASPRRGP